MATDEAGRKWSKDDLRREREDIRFAMEHQQGGGVGAELDALYRGKHDDTELKLDNIDKYFEHRTNEAASAPRKNNAGGRQHITSIGDQLRDELGALAFQAAAARKAAEAKHDEAHEDRTAGLLPAIDKKIIGSFSAAALMAGAGGSSPAARAANAAEQSVKLHKKQIKAIDAVKDAIDKAGLIA